MNRFGDHNHATTHNRRSRYYDDSDDDYGENSSSHSVRVSKLIEKIKNQQIHHRGGGAPHRVPSGKDFSYFEPNEHGSRDSLIYSTIQRGGGNSNDLHKRTVRERVDVRNSNLRSSDVRSDLRSSPLHKTTVLLNNDAPHHQHHHDNDTRLYSDRYVTPPRAINQRAPGISSAPPPQQRYFGDSEYEDYDKNHHKYSSIRSRDKYHNSTIGRSNTFNPSSNMRSGADTLTRNNSSGFSNDTLSRNQNKNYDSLRSNTTRGSVPKIILHEQAIAEIPNGKREPRTRSPSVNREMPTTDEEDGKGRFLGGFLTLKRGKNKERIRSTRSPTPRSRAGSYLNVPNATQHHHHHHDNNDSSSSPKYYVPYRSTPTLYESKYERDRHSSNGSVLSNGSYVNKHVTRSMSVKAPWEPRHRSNEINYFNDRQFDNSSRGLQKSPSKATLSRSKSMPGKKLTSIIGSWVSSRGKKEKHNNNDEKPNDSERLLKDKVVKEPKPKVPGKFGSLFRFGNNSGKGKAEKTERSVSPDRPPRRRIAGERSTPDAAHGTLRRGTGERQAYGTLRSSGGSNNNARFYN